MLRTRGFAIALALLTSSAAYAQPVGTPTATLVAGDGASSNRLKFAIMGDGWTAGKTPDWIGMVGDDSRSNGSIVGGDNSTFGWFPLNAYLPYFNVYRVDMVSAESGIGNSARNTALRGYKSGQYLHWNHTYMYDALEDAGLKVHQIIVIFNRWQGGGQAQGNISAAVLSGYVQYILRHELGHALAGLGDEYTHGSCRRYGRPNVSGHSIVDMSPWAHQKHRSEVGWYEGAYGCETGLWRPTSSSVMNSTMKAPAYSVNAEQFALRIYDKVSPIDAYSPSSGTVTATACGTLAFSVDTVLAAGDLDIEWSVDTDSSLTGDGTSFSFDPCDLPDGTHQLAVAVADDMRFPGQPDIPVIVKDSAGASSDTVTWDIEIEIPGSAENLALEPAWDRPVRTFWPVCEEAVPGESANRRTFSIRNSGREVDVTVSVERSDADGIVNAYHPPGWINPDTDLVLTDANGNLVGGGVGHHGTDARRGGAARDGRARRRQLQRRRGLPVLGRRAAHGVRGLLPRDRRGLPRPVRDLRVSVSFGARSMAFSRDVRKEGRQPTDTAGQPPSWRTSQVTA